MSEKLIGDLFAEMGNSSIIDTTSSIDNPPIIDSTLATDPSLSQNFSLSLIQTISLNLIPQIGPATVLAFAQQGLAFELILEKLLHKAKLPEYSHELIRECLTNQGNSRIFVQAQQMIEQVANLGIHIVHWPDEDFPPLLRQISACPLYLFVRGNPAHLSLPQVAIVGSRKTSQMGLKTTSALAQELVEGGFVVTSGLALGVDSAAHQGALNGQSQNGQGKTIAVLGTGVDEIYPKRNRSLADEILAQDGVIVSEFPISTKAVAQNFPRRNRTISGLSLGTLVVEAAIKSGSLITANYAAEQNRELFAVPGSIHNPLSKGCHMLIKQGAKLVESAQDIFEELDGVLSFHKAQLEPSFVEPSFGSGVANTIQSAEPELSGVDLKVWQAIDYSAVTLDQIVEICELPLEEITQSLLSLELEGHIQYEGIGYIRT